MAPLGGLAVAGESGMRPSPDILATFSQGDVVSMPQARSITTSGRVFAAASHRAARIEAARRLPIENLSIENLSIENPAKGGTLSLSRRRLLISSVPAGLALRSGALAQRPASTDVEFTHGVASGDPTADRVILWTRAAAGSGDLVRGEWWVATDPEGKTVVAGGEFETTASRDWTVKVDAAGLASDRWYHYGFRAAGAVSPVGRTRTLPASGVERVKLAVFSCSNYPFGYFNSYRSAAERDDIDLALHLGDYIYEYSNEGYGGQTAKRLERLADPPHEILSVSDYRRRYAQYRSDQDLQAIHARLPMIVVWDDHEIANNTWHSGAQNHQEESEGSFFDRRAAAVQVFHEWMPTRARSGSRADRIYRAHDIGDLATLIMLDTRLIGRDQQLDYADLEGADGVEAFRARINAPERTMLGAEQEAWLKTQLARSSERGVPWQILGQQLLVGGLQTPDLSKLFTAAPDTERARSLALRAEYGLPLNLDAWDGYEPARERLAQDALSFGNNVVVLAGDTHNSWAFDLFDRQGRQFGVELGTTSVTSPGMERSFPNPDAFISALQGVNPHLRFADGRHRGYLVLTVDREKVRAEWLYVDTIESREFTERLGATAEVRASSEVGTSPLRIG